MIACHTGAGDHKKVCLRRVVDRIEVFERLHLGVDGSGIGGPRGVHTGLLPVLDR